MPTYQVEGDERIVETYYRKGNDWGYGIGEVEASGRSSTKAYPTEAEALHALRSTIGEIELIGILDLPQAINVFYAFGDAYKESLKKKK